MKAQDIRSKAPRRAKEDLDRPAAGKSSKKDLVVLYVEDDPETRGQFSLYLKRRFSTILTAQNGAEAVETFHEKNPDVVVSDIRMPVMDGLAMARTIRAKNGRIPIIFLTAFNEVDYLKGAIDVQVSNYFVKPVEPALLVDNIVEQARRSFHIRKNEAEQRFLQSVLNRHPNFLVIVGPGGVEMVNETFQKALSPEKAITPEEFEDVLSNATTHIDGRAIRKPVGVPLHRQIVEAEVRVKIHLRMPNMRKEEILFNVDKINFGEFDKALLIFNEVTRLEKTVEELEYLANRDSLTSILNRHKFNQELSREIQRARRNKSNLSLVVLDVDNFKQINDTHGHLVGDRVLNRLCRIIQKQIRSQDIFARWGGDELVLLAPATDLQGMHRLADKMRKIIANHKFDGLTVTCSFGCSTLGPDDDPESLFERADLALREAKNLGKNWGTIS